MKEKILEALKTTYSNLGLSKDILDGYAEYLSTTITEETGIEAGVKAIEPLLKQQQKEFDKIRTALKKAEEVKKESPKADDDKVAKKESPETSEKKAKPESQPQPEPKPQGEEMPEYLKKLMASVDYLTKRAADEDKAKVMASRKSEMSKIVSKLPDSIKKAYERINLDVSDDDFEQLKTTVEGEVKSMEKDLAAKRSVFSPPFQSDGEPNKEISKERADRIADRLLNR